MVGEPRREVVLDYVDRLAAGRGHAIEALVAGGHLEERPPRPSPLFGGLGEEGAHDRLDLLRGVLDLSVRPPVDDPDVADARTLGEVDLVMGVRDHGSGGEGPEVDEGDHARAVGARGVGAFVRCARFRFAAGCRRSGLAAGRRLSGSKDGPEHLARVVHLPAVGVEVQDDRAEPGGPRVGEGAGEVARLEPVDDALDANVAHPIGRVRVRVRRAFLRIPGAPRAEGREGNEQGRGEETPRCGSARVFA